MFPYGMIPILLVPFLTSGFSYCLIKKKGIPCISKKQATKSLLWMLFFVILGLVCSACMQLFQNNITVAFLNALIGLGFLSMLMTVGVGVSMLLDILGTAKANVLLQRFGVLSRMVSGCSDLSEDSTDDASNDISDNTAANTDTFLNRFKSVAAPMFGIAYMLFIFGSAESYYGNASEWLFGPKEFLLPGFVAVVLTLLVAVVFALSFKKSVTEQIGLGTSGAFLALYLQNALMNNDKFIDGITRSYSALAIFGNMLFFVVLIVAPLIVYNSLKNRKTVVTVGIVAALFLSIMQLVPLATLMISNREVFKAETKEQIFDGSEQYVVSSKDNVVVFILDTFSADAFDRYWRNHEGEHEYLNEFTYYDNVNTNAVHTPFSMPYLLTSSDVRFDVGLEESNRLAWTGDNANAFYEQMHDAGYKVTLYTDSANFSGGIANMSGKIDNIIDADLKITCDTFGTFAAMTELSLYKYLPYAFKQIFYVYDTDYVNQFCNKTINGFDQGNTSDMDSWTELSQKLGVRTYNHVFYEGLQDGLTTTDENRLVIQHLFGMHQPYTALDGETKVNESEEVDICFTIIEEYIDEMKRLGVYDDCTFIITADHGAHKLASSEPVMLIKEPNATRTSLERNHAPGNIQSDILPTILDLAGLDDSQIQGGGESLLKLEAFEERERIIRIYDHSNEYPEAHKIGSASNSIYNYYTIYTFLGRGRNEGSDDEIIGTGRTVDYWW